MLEQARNVSGRSCDESVNRHESARVFTIRIAKPPGILYSIPNMNRQASLCPYHHEPMAIRNLTLLGMLLLAEDPSQGRHPPV